MVLYTFFVGDIMHNMPVKEFLYRLWFTRDDDLDILQVLFTAIVIVTLFITWHVATDDSITELVKIEGLVTLRWLTGLLVITAVPKWLIPFVTKQTQSIGNQQPKTQNEFEHS
jgi:hypothetical protein